MREDQLKDSLRVQSEQALDFMMRAWPEARELARAVIEPVGTDIGDVILCGCGDSHHAALSLEMAFAAWSGKRVRAAPALTAARYLVPRLRDAGGAALLVGISVSGEVARTLEAVELANAYGVRTLALTGNSDSSLARSAQMSLSLGNIPAVSGPGLLSFLASLLMGYAVAEALSEPSARDEIGRCMQELPAGLESWLAMESEAGDEFGHRMEGSSPVVFLGSGPAYGLALFSAAKLVEAAGVAAWGQDVEEWAHVEYFAEPANTPTWLLSSSGRSQGREDEIAEAALAINRGWTISRWPGLPHWSGMMREVLSPLALWPGPVAFASRRAEQLGEKPFRAFGGGRSDEEGGGASRIRSSRRLHDAGDLQV
jgi:glucosamine--fructose-6-phosphate aminotransferase (isomerizing)